MFGVMAAGSSLPAKAPRFLKASRNGATWQFIQTEPVLRVGSIQALSGMGEFLTTLEELSWRVVPPTDVAALPAHLIAHYGALPDDLAAFIARSQVASIQPMRPGLFLPAIFRAMSRFALTSMSLCRSKRPAQTHNWLPYERSGRRIFRFIFA